jgi:hypothetical protein
MLPLPPETLLTLIPLGTDIFRDAGAVQHLGNQPSNFGIGPNQKNVGTRPSALKNLIASVPTDDTADKKVLNSDKKYLDKAIKAFSGHATVRPAADGQWSIKGMRSTLKHYQVMGTAFMRERETAEQEPRGGILVRIHDLQDLGRFNLAREPSDNLREYATLGDAEN